MLSMSLLFLACSEPSIRVAHPDRDSDADTDADTDADSDSDSDSDSDADTATAEGPCPAEMAEVGAFCVDRWEAYIVDWSPYDVPVDVTVATGVAASAEGQVPQGYISGEMAAAVCANAGKRLCTAEEWLTACSGSADGDGRTYPYGDTYDAAACNDSYEGTGSYGHPVCDYFDNCTDVWDMDHMNDPGINQQPGTEDAAGANPGCVTPGGVYDMHGNLHEWVDDADGTFRGGLYADASINGAGCGYKTTAHELTYHDYSTGFRCCAPRR